MSLCSFMFILFFVGRNHVTGPSLSSDESTKKILKKNKTWGPKLHHPVASQTCRVEMNAYLYVSLDAVQLIRMSDFNLKINELGFPLDLLLLRSGLCNIAFQVSRMWKETKNCVIKFCGLKCEPTLVSHTH